MKYTQIIWDFNGTLLDDVAACIDTQNVLLARRGMPLIRDVEHYRSMFCFPITKYYQNVGYDFDREPYGKVAVEWVEEYLRRTGDMPLYEGVKETLAAIDLPQIVLSATEQNMLEGQLKSLGINGFFDEILGKDNIEAHSKVDLGVAWMKRAKPERALFVGDTDHDALTAAAMGVDCVLIPNGHQSAEYLRNCENVILLRDIRDIPQFLEETTR